MLETFTGEGGASGGGTDDETAGHLITGGPEGVAGALEPEHRVEHVDRDQRLTLCGVGGAGRGECSNGAGLVDPRVKYRSGRRLLICEQQFAVHREVVLAVRVVDLRRGEKS